MEKQRSTAFISSQCFWLEARAISNNQASRFSGSAFSTNTVHHLKIKLTKERNSSPILR